MTRYSSIAVSLLGVVLAAIVTPWAARAAESAAARLEPAAPSAAAALVADGWAAFAAGRSADGIALLEQARDVAPRSVPVLLALVEGYGLRVAEVSPFGKMSLAKKVRQTLDTAVAAAPRDPRAVEGLFRFHLEAPAIAGGSKEQATRLQRELAAMDPVYGRRAAAALAAKRGDLEAAATELRAAVDLRPAERTARLELAVNAQARRSWDEAFSTAEALAGHGHRVGLYQLGRAGALSGRRLPHAEEALRRYLASEAPSPAAALVARDPPADAAWFRLGQVLAHAPARRVEARAAHARALELNPRHDGAKRALAALR